MAGTTRDMVKDMPQFAYATVTRMGDAFVAAADKDIADGAATAARPCAFRYRSRPAIPKRTPSTPKSGRLPCAMRWSLPARPQSHALLS
jgi:hypothetical protein